MSLESRDSQEAGGKGIPHAHTHEKWEALYSLPSLDLLDRKGIGKEDPVQDKLIMKIIKLLPTGGPIMVEVGTSHF